MEKERKNRKILFFVLGFFLVAGLVAAVGYLLGAFSGFPKGHDAYSHVTKLQFISDFFPQYRWHYQWAIGMLFSGSYAPLYYLLGLPLVKAGLAIPNVIIIFCFFTLVLIGLGVFGFIYTMSRSFWAAISGAAIALTSFSVWTWAVEGGVYPRIMGGGLMVMTLWLVAAWAKSLLSNPDKKANGLFFLSVLFLFLTMICHVLLALFTWLLIFFIVVIFPFSWKARWKLFFTVYGFSLFLASFYYFPLFAGFLTGSQAATFLGVIDKVLPMPISYAFKPSGIGYAVIPLLILSLILYPILRAKGRKFTLSPARTVWPPIIGLIIFLFYAFIGYTGLAGKYYYINGFIPFSAAFPITIFSVLIFGSLFGFILQNSSRAKKIIAVLLLAAAVGAQGYVFFISRQSLVADHVYDSSAQESTEYKAQQIIDLPKEEYQYRFANIDAFQADWFNAVYKTPQTRHYYGQGIIDPNWHYWLEHALYAQENFAVEEAKNVLDWFSIKWFSWEDSIETQLSPTLENLVAASKNRYLKDSDFELKTMEMYNNYLEIIENKNAKPILSASNTPNILYIGDKAGYYTFVHNLSFNNYGSDKVIPVLGREYLDDYEILDLYKFDAIFLYSYKYHKQEKAYWLLDNFVKSGRGVILETWDSPDAPIKAGKDINLPEPAPLSRLNFDEVSGSWNFEATQGEQIFTEVEFDQFSPPEYNGDDWKMSTGSQSDVRPWAKIFLANQGKPIIAGGTYGSGRIIWTGFNFSYHINSKKNLAESKLFENMIEWVLQKGPSQESEYEASFINPEKREIEINKEARGIILRENYYPLWQAVIEKDGVRKKAEVFYAGPGLMYIPLSSDEHSPYKVIIYFKYSWPEKIGYIFSALALIILILYIFEDKFSQSLRISRMAAGSSQKISGKIGKWWEKDEDEEQ
jgi:hypothetical protein